ncbi:hypothetical protein FDO65_05010 [Nakamurella flava]|uniref:Uncharacterized protein n=1 Tax=Nakamurella flava TaxID=2576308 RepID=A0A4U6QLI7_9ACTN|nr:hypothetical protein [Nakamurella flava]TKV61012.1 hypothetical protein FDO65_05010 [Nakamurella flava]
MSDADADLTGQQAGAFRIGGVVLVVVGLCWMVVDPLLRKFQPLRWGGPNIGGGFLLIAANATVTAGAVVTGAASAVRPPQWNSMTRIGLAVVAALAFVYLLLRAL